MALVNYDSSTCTANTESRPCDSTEFPGENGKEYLLLFNRWHLGASLVKI